MVGYKLAHQKVKVELMAGIALAMIVNFAVSVCMVDDLGDVREWIH